MDDKTHWLEKWQLNHCSTAVMIREAWTGDYSHCRLPGGATFKCGASCPYCVLTDEKT